MDVFSPDKRSDIMRRIRAIDTKPEAQLRKELFRRGLRYRKNSNRMPGRPDIVFPRSKVAVFVHGCFWHQHPGCRYAAKPKSNEAYWKPKLARNAVRDAEVLQALTELGWTVLVVWECEIRKDLQKEADRVAALVQTEMSKGRARK